VPNSDLDNKGVTEFDRDNKGLSETDPDYKQLKGDPENKWSAGFYRDVFSGLHRI
jgi:hypothetical protein